MRVKILTAVFVVGGLLIFSTGCDICDLLNCPSPGPEPGPGPGPGPGKVLFFDDFEDGPDPAWSAASGTWITQEGRYTIQEEKDAWLSTYVKTKDSLQWRDYAVEVDVFNGDLDWEGAIIIRAQDDRNKVMLRWQHDRNLSLDIWKDGRSKRCNDAIVHPGLTTRTRIRIEAVGSVYTVYVRQGEQGELIKRLWCEDETFSKGMPGLAIRESISIYGPYKEGITSFDNFKVISLEQ